MTTRTTSDEAQSSRLVPSVSNKRAGPEDDTDQDSLGPLPLEADGNCFNVFERTCVMMAISVLARDRLSINGRDKTITEELATEIRKFLVDSGNPIRMQKLPTTTAIREIEHSFHKYGTPEPVHIVPKPKEANTEPNIEGLIAIRKSKFAKRNKIEVDRMSAMVAREMLKEKKVFYYRSIGSPGLTRSHIEQRLSFASEIAKLIKGKTIDPNDICFTGEALVGIGPYEDYSDPGPFLPKLITKDNIDTFRALDEKKEPTDKSVCFKVVQAKAGVVGPYFIETMTPREGVDDKRSDGEWSIKLDGTRYLELLRDYVIPELKLRLSAENWAKCWWLQNERPAHQTDEVRDYLRSQFGDRILSANSKYSLPAKSPDLNMLDYFYWDVMRVIVGDKRPKTLSAVRKCCKKAESSMNWASTLRAIREWPSRIGCLLENKGRHFEEFLQDFKNRTGYEEPCDVCLGWHPCPGCDICESQCLETLTKMKARQNLLKNQPPQRARGPQAGPSSRAQQAPPS